MSRKRDHNAGAESSSAQGVQQRVRQMLVIERLCSRLPLIAQQLQKRYDDRETLHIKDEFDLRDLLNALLLLEHDDVRAETWTPAYSTRPRTDFLLKIERMVLVAKLADADFDAAKLAAHLPADVEHYRRQPDCDTMVCFVYDPEQRIAGARALEHELSDDQRSPTVRVIIAPKLH